MITEWPSKRVGQLREGGRGEGTREEAREAGSQQQTPHRNNLNKAMSRRAGWWCLRRTRNDRTQA